jgi:hypothetical protein
MLTLDVMDAECTGFRADTLDLRYADMSMDMWMSYTHIALGSIQAC